MNTLETHVLELIGENTTTPDVFADTTAGMAPIRDSINDAIQEICLLSGSIKRKWYIPCEEDQFFYQFDTSTGSGANRDTFAWIIDVWLVDQKRQLEFFDFHILKEYNPRWLYNKGTPERFCIFGKDKLVIHPAPSASTDMLEIEGVAIPEAYTLDTDRLKLRSAFQWAAVHFAVSEYWASRGDAKSALIHHKKYLKRLQLPKLYSDTEERAWRYNTEKK